MENPQAEIINAVCGFLSGKGIFPKHSTDMISHEKVEVVNRDGDFPVTIRLQFLDGQFCGVLAGASDLLRKQRGGLKLDIKAQWFEVGDPDFLDHVFAFVKNPYTFFEV